MREVVVTAAGVLSPIGNSLADFKRNLFNQVSGVSRLEGADIPPGYPVGFIARVPQFSTLDYMAREFPKASIYARAVAALLEQISPALPTGLAVDALISGHRDACDLEFSLENRRSGKFAEDNLGMLVRESPLEVMSYFLKHEKQTEVKERNKIWMINACSTANDSLGFAFQKIRAGHWTRALSVTLEFEVNLLQILGLFRLGALATGEMAPETVSRPFAKDRFGFVKGEGAAIFMLEERQAAEERGATILGQISGYANSNDAFRLTDGRPDSMGTIQAIQSALRDAQLSAGEIDMVSAHATSTPMGDILEAQAIENVFGARAAEVPVTALKSQVGHATLACGALETLASLMALSEQTVFPILNLQNRDPLIRLNLVAEQNLKANLNHVLVNSLGFGGLNTSLVLKRYH